MEACAFNAGAEFSSALCVVGAGSYGTSLAMAVASKGLPTLLYARDAGKAELMQAERVNERYLPGLVFPASLKVTADLKSAIEASKFILVVVPSHTFREVLTQLSPYLRPSQLIAWATKGIESGSGRLLSEVAADLLPEGMPLAAISGPTFASELARGLPTAIAVSGTSHEHCALWSDLLHTPTFRIYESSDFVALQLGGSVKNVIAIAAGLSDGLGYGANARTALITRGLAEMVRLGVALGATELGFMGLSGLGDLVLTCTDNQSRNRRFGFMLGQGVRAEEALSKIGQVVEGYGMTREVWRLAERKDVRMPICRELYGVLYEGHSGKEAAHALLGRALTSE